jgi:hypothetical protein
MSDEENINMAERVSFLPPSSPKKSFAGVAKGLVFAAHKQNEDAAAVNNNDGSPWRPRQKMEESIRSVTVFQVRPGAANSKLIYQARSLGK